MAGQFQHMLKDFNPHSRKGSDEYSKQATDRLIISIHTPARGVTGKRRRNSSSMQISIHTPARGVTENVTVSITCANDFNPHSRKGSDVATFLSLYLIQISIHTPARGVTVLQGPEAS